VPAPHPGTVEQKILRLRTRRKLGPARISSILDVPASTVHQVLVRAGMNRIAWMDRPTGRVIRRIHTDRPGELVHVDVKKLGRIPPGGGWRMRGREHVPDSHTTRVGYDYVHSAIDAHTRLAFSEIHADERGPTCAGFWERAERFFAQHDIRIEAVLSDNAKNYLGKDFTAALGLIEHRRIRPRRPQTNGKVERFNRTLIDEWAYVRLYRHGMTGVPVEAKCRADFGPGQALAMSRPGIGSASSVRHSGAPKELAKYWVSCTTYR
jgi:transposase InsO family protein